MPDGLVCSKRARWSYRDRFPRRKSCSRSRRHRLRRGDLVRVVRRWIEDGDVVVLGIGISSILIGPLIEPHGVVYMWRILGRLRPLRLALRPSQSSGAAARTIWVVWKWLALTSDRA